MEAVNSYSARAVLMSWRYAREGWMVMQTDRGGVEISVSHSMPIHNIYSNISTRLRARGTRGSEM